MRTTLRHISDKEVHRALFGTVLVKEAFSLFVTAT